MVVVVIHSSRLTEAQLIPNRGRFCVIVWCGCGCDLISCFTTVIYLDRRRIPNVFVWKSNIPTFTKCVRVYIHTYIHTGNFFDAFDTLFQLWRVWLKNGNRWEIFLLLWSIALFYWILKSAPAVAYPNTFMLYRTRTEWNPNYLPPWQGIEFAARRAQIWR